MIFNCFAVVIAMICQDTFATTMVVAESRNLRRWAGTMDAANDYASRVGTCITAGAFVKTGFFSWETQLLLFLTALTSYNTTSRVTGLANRLLPKVRN
jgi:hypothetical protein